jgi:uncharacterized protein (TIRG00374 family)
MVKQQTQWRGHLRTLLGVLLSGVFLLLAFRDVRLDVVTATLAQINLPLLGAAVAVEIATFWAIAVRWQRFFSLSKAPSVGNLFEILNIAQLVNALLPAQLGPLVRAYLAGRGESSGVAYALTTILGEKIVEGLSLLLVAVAILPLLSLSTWMGPTTGVSLVLFLAALGLMIWVAFRRDVVSGWLEVLLRRWPRLLNLADSALSALAVWRSGRMALAVVGWSAAIWGITVLLNQLLLWSLGIQVPPVAAVLLLIVLQIGVRLPSSPGSIGVFQYLCVVTLSLFGVDRSAAFSYSVILHLVMYLPPSLLGLLYLSRSGYSLSRLRQEAGRVPAQGGPLEEAGNCP